MAYDYLRSRDTRSGAVTSFSLIGVPFDVVANIPVSFLDIQGEARHIIVDEPLRHMGSSIIRFKTLGELASFGYEKLNYYIRVGYLPKKSFTEIMYEIQLALAKFSLKLDKTKFTIFEIKLDDLNLSSAAKAFVKEYFDADTLGDLYISYKDMGRQLSLLNNGAEIRASIKRALLEFGTRPEVADASSLSVIKREKELLEKSIRDNKDKVFPSISRFAKYSVSDPLSKEEWMSGKQYFQDVECDYTGLLERFKFEFLTEDELFVSIGIDQKILERIKSGQMLNIEVISKLCKYFNAKVEELVTFKDESKAITSQQILEYQTEQGKPKNDLEQNGANQNVGESTDEQGDASKHAKRSRKNLKPYDYSALIDKIMKLCQDRLSKFKDIYPISQEELNKIKEGRPISYITLVGLAEFFECKLEDLFTCDHEIFEKTYATKIIQSKESYKNKAYDYSNLKILLAEKLLSISQLASNLNLSQSLAYRVNMGEKISDELLNQIADYLGCKVSDIVTFRPENQQMLSADEMDDYEIARNKTEIPVGIRCSYLGLYNLMKQRGISKQQLIRDALIHSVVFSANIEKGLPISKLYMVRLCYYFDCKEEDLVSYVPIYASEGSQGRTYGHFNGLAESKTAIVPTPKTSARSGETTVNSSFGANERIGGASSSGGARKPKFYMGRNGYINLERNVVKLYNDSERMRFELDYFEPEF